MKTENLTQSLKPTSQTASFRLLVIGGMASLLLPILYPLACNLVLPSSDANTVKGFFFDISRVVLPLVVGGGGLGTVAGSLLKTGGKVAAQLAPGFATDATPNGEGIGALAPIGALVAQHGFDVRDFNIGAPVPDSDIENSNIEEVMNNDD